jgi:large subunit ribosomal protein L25|uniref:Large ribosomal subunit protein bL25 n=1 Tax=candidate division WOR-3 bacterium TaxID=2052148 RepID=A0A7C6A889_UNCW3
MIYSIKAEIRDRRGKSAVRNLRRDGLVPAVLYGRKMQPINLVIKEKEFLRLLEEIKGHSPIIELELPEEKAKCVIKLIQRHPISLKLLHVDFQKVQAQEKIQVAVPVILTGVEKSIGVKAGGILEHTLREIPLKAEVDKIPEHIEIDISNLKLGHSIHIADLKLPGVEFALPTDTVIVSVLAPRKVEEVVTPVAAEEMKEPEVITEKKKEEEPSEEDKEKKGKSEKEVTAKKEKSA